MKVRFALSALPCGWRAVTLLSRQETSGGEGLGVRGYAFSSTTFHKQSQCSNWHTSNPPLQAMHGAACANRTQRV